MTQFIFGAVGALVALGLVAVGIFIGWKSHQKFTEKAKVVAESQYTEQQVRQMQEDKVAFEELLRYNAATAYGADRGLDELTEDDA